MQVTITTISEVEHEADIEVSGEELQPHFETAYEKFRPKAELKGFRKGKVPMPMIKKLYGEAIEHDSLDDIANELYRQAMEERNIHPIGTPAMVDMDFKRKQYFRFKIKYEVKPDFQLQKYKGLPVEKPVHRVTDEEVDAEIHHLRRVNSTTSDAAEALDREHVVTCDVQELDEAGTPLIGKKTPDARFYLADETLSPEIAKALVGAKASGTYQATVQSQHEDHAHRNHLQFTVTKIQKVELPVFDETLVKKITSDKVTSPEVFRADLKADLERYWEEQGTGKVNDAIANELVRIHEFLVPESLVQAFQDSFVDEIKNRSRDKKLPAGFDEKKFRDENRAYAVWQAKWTLIKERIAEEEKLSVSDDDYAALAGREAGRIGIDAARLAEYYKKSGATAERILSEKIMSMLRDSAKLTERVVDEKSK